MVEKEAVVIIPVYKKTLNWYESISLHRVVEVLSSWDIAIIAPVSLDFDFAENIGIKYVERFADEYFRNVAGYNKLMLSIEFYERFLAYEYMLIYQLDAFVFRDNLATFCSLPYDYIGAPFTPPMGLRTFRGQRYQGRVGNGGLSLRRIKACIDLLQASSDVLKEWRDNEDMFFAYSGKYKLNGFRIPSSKVAGMFSFERPVLRRYRKNHYEAPFACHAWMLYGKEIYTTLFRLYGIDLTPYQADMKNDDLDDEARAFSIFFRQRFIRKKDEMVDWIGQNDEEWSIYGFGVCGRNLVQKMQARGNRLGRIYSVNSVDKGKIWRGIPICSESVVSSGGPRLIVAVMDEFFQPMENQIRIGWAECIASMQAVAREKSISRKLEAKGLTYGKDYICLGYEYAKKLSWCGCSSKLYGGVIAKEADIDFNG